VNQDVVILIADDDEGHVRLIEKNLRRAGLANRIERFANGREVLDFLFCRGARQRERAIPYYLLLDIRMPGIDGVEVLRQIRGEPELHSLPVSMLTTTDDPIEVARCHKIGCNNYIVKPVDYQKFADAIQRMGLFVKLVQVPSPEAAGRR
jgi:CheY-like chemotaxis protein